MVHMNRRIVMAVEAGALAVALMLCAADRFIAWKAILPETNLQQDLQQLFLLLKEEMIVFDEYSR